LYARPRPEIAQLVKPASKDGCLPEFDHPVNVAERLHHVKAYCDFGNDVTPNVQANRRAAPMLTNEKPRTGPSG